MLELHESQHVDSVVATDGEDAPTVVADDAVNEDAEVLLLRLGESGLLKRSERESSDNECEAAKAHGLPLAHVHCASATMEPASELDAGFAAGNVVKEVGMTCG